MEDIHYFTLPSGVECGIIPLTGHSQEVYTNQTYIRNGSMLGHLLKTFVHSIGGCENIGCNLSQENRDKQTGEFVDVYDLLETDMQCILFQAHKLEHEFAETFIFDRAVKGWKFDTNSQEYKPITKTITFQLDLTQVETSPIMLPHTLEDGTIELRNTAFKTYREVVERTRNVPVSTKEGIYYFDFMTLGMASKQSKPTHGGKTNPKPFNVLDTLRARNVRKEDQHPNLTTTANKTITAVQKAIKQCEGKFDLSVTLDNPLYVPELSADEDNLPEIRTHLIGLPDFLFPGVA